MAKEDVVETETEDEAEDRGDSVPAEETKAEAVEEVKEEQEEEQEEEEEEKPNAIPYTRFRAQNIQLRQAEKQIAELSQQIQDLQKQAPKPEPKKETRDLDTELSEAESKLEAATRDNDVDTILKLSREIRLLERELIKQDIQATREETTQVKETLAEQAFNDMLSVIESEFPELDPTSDVSDSVKMEAVQALLNAYENQGFTSDDALIKAVAVIYPDSELAQDMRGGKTEKTTEAKPKSDRGLSKKIEAAAKLPPNINKAGGEASDTAGLDSELDVSKLSNEEFDALPESTKRRVRGDTFAA